MAVSIEEEGQIEFCTVAMLAEQCVDRRCIPGLYGTAELQVCSEDCACGAQPGMARGRKLTGDGPGLVQDLVGPVRDFPVGGQQYRADGTELGKDDEQSGKGQDFLVRRLRMEG